MIAIVDYGLGNLRSVAAAIDKVGFVPCITNKYDDLKKADKLILPGVGAFSDGMKNIQKLGLHEILNEFVFVHEKPILCICLGFQMLAKESYEFGYHKGLGWIDASIIKLDVNKFGLRVPHVGWNDLIQVKKSILFDEIPQNALFYYVHSYHCESRDENSIIGECLYGKKFISAIQKKNIYATQFHPEKSQYYGLKLIHNFLSKA